MSETHATAPLPFVSIVVPALNCAEDVQGFADSIRQQDYPHDRYEVIVVDNGSIDDTFERIRTSGLVALLRRERGRARALNTGVAAARGEFILTTDLSCRPEPNWIRTILDTFAAHPEAGCVAGEIKLLKEHRGAVIDFQERSNYMSPMLALDRMQLPFMPFADGANASFRKEVFEKIGGFEESFFKAADVEICYRMLIFTDYTLVFNRSALVWEPGEPTLRALLHQRFRMGMGANLLRLKYPGLYGSVTLPASVRQTYWRFRESLSATLKLAAINLGALFGLKREAAIDADIRVLMKWSQWYGRLYGRWWMKRKGIHPAPADKSAIDLFISRTDTLRGRVVLTKKSGA